MGIYINPGNSGFAEINDADYVDKTMLIELINQTVGKKNKLTCISRPRRFGKSNPGNTVNLLDSQRKKSCGFVRPGVLLSIQ